MKKFAGEFLKRGLLAAAGGPVVLAIVYGCLGTFEGVTALSPSEVSEGILSVTVMAFIAAGITAIYQTEKLPLAMAILLHAGVLYLDYLVMYLLNSWIPRDLPSIGFFTAVFVLCFAAVWLLIYLSIKLKTERINRKLLTDA